MDLELGLIVLGVAGVTTIAVYLVSVLGIKEKTFEEAIAEQKKRSEELLGRKPQSKNNKNSAAAAAAVREKKNNKKRNVVKQHLQHHVEIVEEPIVLDEHVPLRRPSLVKSSDVKPILVNRETTTTTESPKTTARRVVREEVVGEDDDDDELVAAPANHFEATHPKDDAELHKAAASVSNRKNKNNKAGFVAAAAPAAAVSSEEEESSSSSSSSAALAAPAAIKKSAAAPAPLQVEEPVVVVAEPVTITNNSAPVQRKSKKSTAADSSSSHLHLLPPLPRLESQLLSSHLTSLEIQSLIETLLEKQQHSENVSSDSNWTSNKRTTSLDPLALLKKQLEEKDRQLVEEQQSVVSLQETLKKLRLELSQERTRTVSLKKQVDDVVASRAGEVNQVKFSLRKEVQRAESEKLDAQRKFAQLQEVCKKMSEDYEGMKAEGVREVNQLRVKCENLQSELGAHKTQFGHLSEQLQSAFLSNGELQDQVSALQHSLVAAEGIKMGEVARVSSLLDKHVQEKESLLKTVKSLEDRLVSLGEENLRLKEELVVVRGSGGEERVAELERKWEDSVNSEKNLRNTVEDLRGVVRDKEGEVMRLEGVVREREEKGRREVRGLEERLVGVEGEREERSRKVEDLRVRNARLLETVQATEKALEEKMSELETLRTLQHDSSSSLEEVLRRKLPSLGQSDSLSSTAVESAIDGLVREASNAAASVARKEAEEVAAKLAANAVAAAAAAQVAVEEKTGAGEEEEERLRSEVQHYQDLLAKTETLLCSLQGSIEEEEEKWRAKLAEKDAVIQQHQHQQQQQKLIVVPPPASNPASPVAVVGGGVVPASPDEKKKKKKGAGTRRDK